MNAYGARLGGRMRPLRAAAVAFAFVLSLPAWAQGEPPQALVSNAERQHAAMMILFLVMAGIALTLGLLWALRRKGILPEEKPRGPLDELQDEIARRSDEINKP